jgi:glycosyltransferase involved in cell wall biosynthesis
MKIYVEASSFYGNRSGVGRYGFMLTRELVKIRQQDTFTLFGFLRPGRNLPLDAGFPSNAKQKFIRTLPGRVFSLLMRNGIALPLELFGLREADLLIFPNFISWSSFTNKPRVCIVHDVAFLYYPEFIQKKNLAYLKTQLSKSLERSTSIIAVSEATKSDLIKHFNVPADKITVIHNAVDHDLFNPGAVRATKKTLEKFSLPNRYLLFVGNIEPRKNLSGLLQAYQQSYATHHLPLVIVGAKGWNDDNIHKQFGELKDLPIYRTDFVSDKDLAALYAGAEAFIYPSFYEGFGIPVLEAMASGCPVICSNISSFPEVVGEAALAVSPDNIDEIAQAITLLTYDLKLRKKLIKRGIERAKLFTWQESARRLSNVINEMSIQKSTY